MSVTTFGIISLLLLVLIVGVVVVLAARGARGRPGFGAGRKPRRRHAVVRIICGVLGAGILIALGVGTWMGVRGAYAADADAGKVKLHLPARPAPELPKPKEKHGEAPLEGARLLLHFVFETGGHLAHAEEIEVNWPADRGRNFVRKGKVKGVSYEIAFTPLSLSVQRWGGEPRIEGQEQFIVRLRGGTWSSSRSGGFSYRRQEVVTNYRSGEVPSPLSVFPAPRTGGRLISFVHRAAKDDPLEAVRLKDYMGRVGLPAAGSDYVPGRSRLDPAAPPLFHLLGHIGLASLFLMAAAILLAQLFARRGLGFAAVLAGCVLYVAVLDRSALAAHAARLGNDKLPVATRCLAAESLAGTFFHRKSAREAARSAAGEKGNPERLRRTAGAVAGRLEPAGE